MRVWEEMRKRREGEKEEDGIGQDRKGDMLWGLSRLN